MPDPYLVLHDLVLSGKLKEDQITELKACQLVIGRYTRTLMKMVFEPEELLTCSAMGLERNGKKRDPLPMVEREVVEGVLSCSE